MPASRRLKTVLRLTFAGMLAYAGTSAPVLAELAGAAPSFDCAKATEKFEAAICHDPSLARLDVELDRLYRALPAEDPARRVHRMWNGFRRDCGADADCIFDLQIRSYMSMGGPEPWEPWLREAARMFKRPSRLAAHGGDLGWGLHLPKTVGACGRTFFVVISDRFGGDPKAPDAAGTATLLGNGSYLVTYGSDATLIASRPGDPVLECLVSIPEDCPLGDERGREYDVTNLRTPTTPACPTPSICAGALDPGLTDVNVPFRAS